MNPRCIVAAAIVCALPLSGAAQTRVPRTSFTPGAPAPRTPDGHPDLHGIWDFRTITPLERPSQFADKNVLSAEEAAALEQRTAETRVDRKPRAGDPGTYNQFWFDFGSRVVDDKRTSLIVDPPDGRLPALTPEADRRAKERATRQQGPATGPEDRPTWERCILGFNAGPPIMPSGYNNNMQVIQTCDYVVIVNEMVHDARIVPLRSGAFAAVSRWLGESRGHREGDTLVVETKNFSRNGTGTIGLRALADENLHLIERFTLRDSGTLLYQFTVDDPTVWTKPWTAVVPMSKSDERIYEYACHEGNIGMRGILAGARELDREAPADGDGGDRGSHTESRSHEDARRRGVRPAAGNAGRVAKAKEPEKTQTRRSSGLCFLRLFRLRAALRAAVARLDLLRASPRHRDSVWNPRPPTPPAIHRVLSTRFTPSIKRGTLKLISRPAGLPLSRKCVITCNLCTGNRASTDLISTMTRSSTRRSIL